MLPVVPITLAGRLVELQPLERRHAAGLLEAAGDDEVWLYVPMPQPRSLEDAEAYIDAALAPQALGTELPFAIVDRRSGRIIGQTSYLDIATEHGHLEIGTWLAREHWRSGINTECKYLMLRHAFETLGCIRVQFKADLRNERSHRALERIGAVREGVLRKVAIIQGGFQRSSVYYSVLDDEWPSVKARLEAMLQAMPV